MNLPVWTEWQRRREVLSMKLSRAAELGVEAFFSGAAEIHVNGLIPGHTLNHPIIKLVPVVSVPVVGDVMPVSKFCVCDDSLEHIVGWFGAATRHEILLKYKILR